MCDFYVIFVFDLRGIQEQATGQSCCEMCALVFLSASLTSIGPIYAYIYIEYIIVYV